MRMHMLNIINPYDIEISVVELWISLRYIMNKIGPKIEPCGTPHCMVSSDDLLLSISIYCCLLQRYLWNHELTTPLIPIFVNLLSNILWLIVSNALLRSKNVAMVIFFVGLSFSSAIWLIRCINGWIVECLGLNPYWCLYIIG